MERAQEVLTVLDQQLNESGGPWLFGDEYTAADGMAAIWVQWMVWVQPTPAIAISPRVKEFLTRAQARPAWKKTAPQYGISYILTRLYAGIGVVCVILSVCVFWTVWSTSSN